MWLPRLGKNCGPWDWASESRRLRHPASRADPMTARRSPPIVRSPARSGSSVPWTPRSLASGHPASLLQ